MNVKLSRSAVRDFDNAADYLIKESPVAARKFADTLRMTFAALAANPNMGRATDTRDWRVFALTAFRYNIFYRIDGELVIIERIFHTAQDPKSV